MSVEFLRIHDLQFGKVPDTTTRLPDHRADKLVRQPKKEDPHQAEQFYYLTRLAQWFTAAEETTQVAQTRALPRKRIPQKRERRPATIARPATRQVRYRPVGSPKGRMPIGVKAMLVTAIVGMGFIAYKESDTFAAFTGFSLPSLFPSSETRMLTDTLNPYQMAVELTAEQQLEYAQLHYGTGISLRRDFEPDTQFPPSVEDWRPYVMRAIHDYNQEKQLNPTDDLAPTVLEFLQVINIETCGAAWDSRSAALWPAGVVAKWHPTQAANVDDKWLNIKAGVEYFGKGLLVSKQNGLVGKEAVLRAYAFYNGSMAGFRLEKEEARAHMGRAAEWMNGTTVPQQVVQQDGTWREEQVFVQGQSYSDWWAGYAKGCIQMPAGWPMWVESQKPK